MSVGENIRDLREKKGMTQDKLARKVYVAQSMICMIERGTKQPSLLLGKAIADALGCSVEDLLK